MVFCKKKHAFAENQGKTLLWKKGSCFVFFRSPEHGARNPELRSPEPGARSPEPGAGAWSTEPGARSPDPELRTLDPGPRTPDPALRIRDPGPRSSEPGARSPRARAASGPLFFPPLVPARPRALNFFPASSPRGHQLENPFLLFDRPGSAAYPALLSPARAGSTPFFFWTQVIFLPTINVYLPKT